MIDLSKKERDELVEHYVKPNMVKVLNSEPIDTYNQIAKTNLAEAWKTLTKTNTSNTSLDQIRLAYVHLKCVQQLLIGVDGLVSHNAFNSKYNEKNKLWAKRNAGIVQDALEKLTNNWNDYLERQLLLQGIDEFDEENVLAFDDTNNNTTISKRNNDNDDNNNNSSYDCNNGRIGGASDGMLGVAVDLNEVASLIKTEIQQQQQLQLEEDLDNNNNTGSYLSTEVSEIIKILVKSNTISKFISPKPIVTKYDLKIGNRNYKLLRYDYLINLLPFLNYYDALDTRLRLTNAAQETNRCFFLHLGVAVSYHPFALQTCMRMRAREYLLELEKDDYRRDILESVLEPSGFVDLNALCFLWPVEFKHIRICCISGSWQRPLITVIQTEGSTASSSSSSSGSSDSSDSSRRGGAAKDVILHCDGQHFTLLGPQDTPKLLNDIIADGTRQGLIVYVHNAQIATATHLQSSSSSSSGSISSGGSSELFSIAKSLGQVCACSS